MTVNPTTAVAAYARQTQDAMGKGMEPRAKDSAQNFADLVGNAISQAIDSGKQGEALTAKALAGEANLQEVVTAVTNAEVTLQTAVAIRDRVIQAYQDIMKMPI